MEHVEGRSRQRQNIGQVTAAEGQEVDPIWNPRFVAIFLFLVFCTVSAALGQISSPDIFWILLDGAQSNPTKFVLIEYFGLFGALFLTRYQALELPGTGMLFSLSTMAYGITRAVREAQRRMEMIGEGGGGGVRGGRGGGGAQRARLRRAARVLASTAEGRRRLALMLHDGDFTGNDYEILQQLDEDVESPAVLGASVEEISRLPTHSFSSPSKQPESGGKIQSCSICLQPFEDGEEVRTIPCLHQFHADCVDRWLTSSATCPVCKFSAIG